MKQILTNRTSSFEEWRINNIKSYGDFIWPQLNYDTSNADIISVIFEEKYGIINNNIPNILKTGKYFIINFNDNNSQYYIKDVSNIKNMIGLSLSNDIDNSDRPNTYWNYRLKTRPVNCLTTDIDSLEICADNRFTTIEADQLFDTSSVDKAIPHIFKTFNFRQNKVNSLQYLATIKYSDRINAKSYVLFHKINNNILDESSPVFLLKNDIYFYNMLNFIFKLKRNDLNIFTSTYYDYLKNNMLHFKNIKDAYNYLKY